MTKSKGARLIQELISKYGDAVIAESYDYYATRIIDEKSLEYNTNPEDVILERVHLSEIETVTSWDDLHRLEEIAAGKRSRERCEVEVSESKARFNSSEQEKLREKRSQDFRACMGYLWHDYPFRLKEYSNVFDVALSDSTPTSKEFGMALDNSPKRHQLSK